MKIGVVCEGVTDFCAIRSYLGAALSARGITSQIIAVQPNPDNASGGGWPQVLTWLIRNAPEQRLPLFSKGLFESSSRLSGFDALLIHLDTDVIPEPSFRNFVVERHYVLGDPVEVADKAAEVIGVILHFAKSSELAPQVLAKHITAPIAEASEAWCVAADEEFPGNPELLSGKQLTDAFGAALARFSNQTVKASYDTISKKAKSRNRYCLGAANRHELVARCSLFGALVEKVYALSQAK